MRIQSLAALLLFFILISGCGQDNGLVGVWKATSAVMEGAPQEAIQAFLRDKAPAFDLNSDKTAHIFGGETIGGGRTSCDGSWKIENEIVKVKCPQHYLELEFNGRTLTTLPDKTFTFERQ